MMDQEEMIEATEDDMEIEENTMRGIWPGGGVEALIFTETGIEIGRCIDGDQYLSMALIAGNRDYGVLGG